MINILKGISIALSGKGKQLLLGGAFVILPFLLFVWNGIWEYRILIFLAMMVLGAALLYCVEWLMSGKKVIGISRLDVAVGVYLVYCAINNLLHDNVGLIEPIFYVKWAVLIVLYVLCRGMRGKHGLFLCRVFTLSAFLQSSVSLLQYFGVVTVTLNGNFVNSAGFANTIPLSVYLGIGLVCGLKVILENLRQRRKISLSICVIVWLVILVAFVLCMCRASLLGLVLVGAVYLISENKVLKQRKMMRRIVYVGMIVVLSGVVYGLYLYRVSSANTRFLLWRVSWDMARESPVAGRGVPGFAADYMQYQGEYFRNEDSGAFVKIANNHYQSYNIFVHAFVEQGAIGLMLLLGIVVVLFKAFKRNVYFYSFVFLLLASCFMYSNHVLPLMVMFPVLLGSAEAKGDDAVCALRLRLEWGLAFLCVGLVLFTLIVGGRYGNVARVVENKGIIADGGLLALCRSNRQFNLTYSRTVYNSQDLDAEDKLEVLEYLNEGMVTSDKVCDMGDLCVSIGDMVGAEKYYMLSHNMVPCRVIPLHKLFVLYKDAGNGEKAALIATKILETDFSVVSSVTLRAKKEAREYLRYH